MGTAASLSFVYIFIWLFWDKHFCIVSTILFLSSGLARCAFIPASRLLIPCLLFHYEFPSESIFRWSTNLWITFTNNFASTGFAICSSIPASIFHFSVFFLSYSPATQYTRKTSVKHHFLAVECSGQTIYQYPRDTQIHRCGDQNFHRLISKGKDTIHALCTIVDRDEITV